MTNLTEVQNEDNREFLIGDVVVTIDPFFGSDLYTIKEIYKNHLGIHFALFEEGGFWRVSGIRHATVAELNANRRLSDAEMALGEVP
ncbi:hypothetical protein [Acinetobacter soli]|nr:hypothetical protein [Acinetobacter soli]